jgi:SAM domain (Sterile alpha motif)
MEQIADWLKKLGMFEYTDRFIENRIDLSVLEELTDQDLKDLGVVLGDRRKMLRAIRDLGNASAAVTASSVPVATEPNRPARIRVSCATPMRVADHGTQIFGIEPCRERRRADKVGEHDDVAWRTLRLGAGLFRR